MLKNCTRLECIVNEKTGHFYCDIDTPLPIAKEMIFQFQKYIGLVEDQVRTAEEEAKKKEEPASEEFIAVDDSVHSE
jgi:hypothetical protein